MDSFEIREYRQIRAIKKYAKSLNLDFEAAIFRWCDKGLAKTWAKKYKLGEIN